MFQIPSTRTQSPRLGRRKSSESGGAASPPSGSPRVSVTHKKLTASNEKSSDGKKKPVTKSQSKLHPRETASEEKNVKSKPKQKKKFKVKKEKPETLELNGVSQNLEKIVELQFKWSGVVIRITDPLAGKIWFGGWM